MAMSEKKGAAAYHAVAAVRGAAWEGPEVPNANTRTGWRCLRCGRRWKAIYNSLQRGSACPACGVAKRSNTQRAKPDDYHGVAKARGFLWAGPEVLNAYAKTGWRCAKGHSWMATYCKVKSGRGCPTCAGAARTARAVACRHAPAQYHALAGRRGFSWKGPCVTHANARTGWRCSEGHCWDATYNKILHGRGCPGCAPVSRASKLRRKPADYHSLASARGVGWIGPEVADYRALTRWRCKRGHAWEAGYSAIWRGYGCPVCGNRVNGRSVSQVQRTLARRLGGELNHRVGRRCIDVVIEREGVQLGVEYHGWRWHGGQQALDDQREADLIRMGWRLLVIRSAYALPSPEELEAAIGRLLAGEERVVITMPDWGVGPVRGQAYDPGRKTRPYRRKAGRHA